MTNEELFTDLKQIIETTVSQQVASLAHEVKHLSARMDKMDARFDNLDTKLDEIQEAIADTLTHSIEAVDTTKQVQDHEQRLRRLERRAA